MNESAGLGAGAVCANHPENPATGLCERCGDFICGYCVRPTGMGQVYCPRCAEGDASFGGDYSALAWENPEQHGGPAAAFFSTLKDSSLAPFNDFYKTVDPFGGYAKPIWFIVLAYVPSVLSGLISAGVQVLFLEDQTRGQFPEEFQAFWLFGVFGGVLLAPLFIILGEFLRAGWLHLCGMITGASAHGFAANFRIVAYANGPNVITGIFGILIGLVGFAIPEQYQSLNMLTSVLSLVIICYTLVLYIVGLRDVQGVSLGAAIGTVAIYVGAAFALCCLGILGLAGLVGGL